MKKKFLCVILVLILITSCFGVLTACGEPEHETRPFSVAFHFPVRRDNGDVIFNPMNAFATAALHVYYGELIPLDQTNVFDRFENGQCGQEVVDTYMEQYGDRELVGWYTERELINRWDFQNDRIYETNVDYEILPKHKAILFNLYARFYPEFE